MNNWKVIFATVVIFGAGVLTGGLLVDYVKHSNYKPPRKPAPSADAHASASNTVTHAVANIQPRLPELLSKQFLQRLDQDLRLSPDQHEAILKIINERQSAMHKVVQDARLEIQEVLTPKQHEEFDEMLKRLPRKTGAGTNDATAFKARLERIIELQRTNPGGTVPPPPLGRTVSPSSAPGTMSPEQEVLVIERERARLLAEHGVSLPPVPPPPILTNSP
ncbi:MAG: hypothetical protein WCS94_05115 [Verrucomicrobiota bacterium]